MPFCCPTWMSRPSSACERTEMIMDAAHGEIPLRPKWYTVAQVAELLGYGESKVRTLIISGDLRSLKDGRSRRVLPEWVDAYVAMRAAEAEEVWYS
jgi:excisionase family DNA binding protein